MNKIYYFLDSHHRLGYTGRVYDIPEDALQHLCCMLEEADCNPQDYIFESSYNEDAKPYWWVKPYINIA